MSCKKQVTDWFCAVTGTCCLLLLWLSVPVLSCREGHARFTAVMSVVPCFFGALYVLYQWFFGGNIGVISSLHYRIYLAFSIGIGFLWKLWLPTAYRSCGSLFKPR